MVRQITTVLIFFFFATVSCGEYNPNDEVSLLESLVSHQITSASCHLRCRSLADNGEQREICTRVCALNDPALCSNKICGLGCTLGCTVPAAARQSSVQNVRLEQEGCDLNLYSAYNNMAADQAVIFIVGGRDGAGMWRVLKERSSSKIYLSAEDTGLYTEIGVLAVTAAGVVGRSSIRPRTVNTCSHAKATQFTFLQKSLVAIASSTPKLYIAGACLVLAVAVLFIVVFSVIFCRRRGQADKEQAQKIERLERGCQLQDYEDVFVDLCQDIDEFKSKEKPVDS